MPDDASESTWSTARRASRPTELRLCNREAAFRIVTGTMPTDADPRPCRFWVEPICHRTALNSRTRFCDKNVTDGAPERIVSVQEERHGLAGHTEDLPAVFRNLRLRVRSSVPSGTQGRGAHCQYA